MVINILWILKARDFEAAAVVEDKRRSVMVVPASELNELSRKLFFARF